MCIAFVLVLRINSALIPSVLQLGPATDVGAKVYLIYVNSIAVQDSRDATLVAATSKLNA